MDPVTQALTLAATIAQIILTSIQAMPPDQRAEFARLQLEDLRRWHDLIDKIIGAFPK